MDDMENVHEWEERVKKIVQGDVKLILTRSLDELPDLHKHKKPLKKAAHRLLGHTEHCIRTHLQKTASLRVGLNVLKEVTWPSIWKELQDSPSKTNGLEDRAPALLQHFFLNLLRLHDGLILLASGECRHEGDIKEARGSKFPSRLGQNTAVYNAHLTYSGASWDEWNDPSVGLKSQWKKLISKLITQSSNAQKRNQRKILPLLVPLLNAMDTAAVQEDFSSLVNKQVVPMLKMRFSQVRVSMVDKMEELRLLLGDSRTIHLQRRGKQLQIRDPQGVLPVPTEGSQSLRDQWLTILKIPSSVDRPKHATVNRNVAPVQRQKRRRIIEDDDDDENEDPVANSKDSKKTNPPPHKDAQKATDGEGLVVTIKTAEATLSTPNKVSTSLDSIKQRMGVSADALAESHETFQAEAVATMNSSEHHNESQEDVESVSKDQAEKRVQHLRKSLKRKRQNQPKGSNFEMSSTERLSSNDYLLELWDTQELLREALMTAGNALLWSKNIRELKRAQNYFEEATKLVLQDQASLLTSMATREPTPLVLEEESRSYQRALMLFAGRAEVNNGIVQINLWHLDRRSGAGGKNASHVLTHANGALNSGKLRAQQMRKQAHIDLLQGSQEDALFDEIRALELESLAIRWQATCLWYQGVHKSSWEAFKTAASLLEEIGKGSAGSSEQRDPDSIRSELQLCTECYYSWMTAFDLGSTELVELSAAKLQENEDEASWLLETCQNALFQASQASHDLDERLRTKVPLSMNLEGASFMTSYDVLSSEEILSIKNDFSQWWKDKQTCLRQSLRRATVRDKDVLFSSTTVSSGNHPKTTQRFTVAADPSTWRRRRNKSRRNIDAVGSNYNNVRVSSNEENSSCPATDFVRAQPVAKYRKWGDELLPQTIDPHTGATVPILQYPSIPPEMPPEVAAIARRIGHPLAPRLV